MIFDFRVIKIFTFIRFALLFMVGASPVWADPVLFDNNPVIGIIDAKPILMDDIENAQTHELRVRLYQLQSQVLKEKIIREFTEAHPGTVQSKARTVTQADIIAFYEKTPRAKEMGSLEEMQGQLRAYLERIARAAETENKYQTALEDGWARVMLTPPNDFKVVAPVGNAALWFKDRTPESRNVFVLEFSDFQCPFCKRVQPTLDKLRRRYGEDVQFGYRHFPLPFHKEAQSLAEATECARSQGKFWELQSVFYKKSAPDIKTEVLEHAKEAGIANIQEFKACWESQKYRDKVLKDISEGRQLGIQATPAFIIGRYDANKSTITGEVVSGALPEEQFKRLITKYLTQARSASTQ